MSVQEHLNYQRIELAINHIRNNFKNQPSLGEIAKVVGISPSHFQRLFSDWAGVSPKKFIQYMSIEHAKELLKREQATLLDTAYETGLSGTSRLHDLFVNIEAMTPGEFKNGGQSLNINYDFVDSPFGRLFVASTNKGVCQLFFENNEIQALSYLKSQFSNAQYCQASDHFQKTALSIFHKNWHQLDDIKLHLKGTDFQLKVWNALLNIPMGGLTTYGSIAKKISKPKAARTVGTAIGSNPIAFVIPCHRVIQASGNIGGYMWGPNRKLALIGWEAAGQEVVSGGAAQEL